MTTSPATPSPETILIIDDAEPDPDGGLMRRLASYRTRWLQNLTEVDGYLTNEAPNDPPMAALIDVNFNPHKGLDALFRLRRAPATERTVPILFTSTVVPGTRLIDAYPAGDLHAVFCAYACRGAGILICSKEHELDVLAQALPTIAMRWRNPNSRVQHMVGVAHGDLRMVTPVRDLTSGVRRSLIHSLLGNDMKQDLWEYIARDKSNPQRALHEMLSDYAQADWASRPSLTLDSRPGGWRNLPDNPLRQFVGGEIGRVATSWHEASQDFLDPSVTAYGDLTVPDRPQDEEYAAPSTAFTLFAAEYALFLSRWETKNFAAWYLDQPWA